MAALVTVLAGCGNTYRPVVTAINPVGPAGQPQKYAVAISNPNLVGATTCPASIPSGSAPGLITIVDFSGDSVLVNANVGVDPYYFQVSTGGNTGYTLNADQTVTSFDISSSLMTNQVLQTTLINTPPPCSNSVFPEGAFTYITEPGHNAVAVLTGTPGVLQEELAIPTGFTPVYVAGIANGPRSYAITPSTTSGNAGQVSAIENISLPTISNLIPVGINPVYGVMTADARRAFILNHGDGTVTVVNAQANALDSFSDPTSGTPTHIIPLSTVAQPALQPIWADFAPTLNEIAVVSAGATTSAKGALSLISIPICSATALPNNPNCDVNNPVDAAGFGTILQTVPVGINPVMVSVLQDGTFAFVANAGDPTLPCAATPVAGVSTACSVSVINLTNNTVVATLPSLPDAQCSTATALTVCGHPSYIVATTGTPTGKVYVVSSDSKFLSVIRTDTDTVQAVVPLQGNGVSVRVTAQ